jgi:hypothetical protein
MGPTVMRINVTIGKDFVNMGNFTVDLSLGSELGNLNAWLEVGILANRGEVSASQARLVP